MAVAAPTIDGTLTPGEGYGTTPLVVQTQTGNVTSAGSANGPGTRATASSVATSMGGSNAFNQNANLYGYVDATTNSLNLFIGGSTNRGYGAVEQYAIALRTKAGGVANLNGQFINGAAQAVNNGGNTSTETDANTGLRKVQFNFSPNAFFLVEPEVATASDGTTPMITGKSTGVGTTGFNGFTDLTGSGNTSTPTVALNNALAQTPIGTTGNPSFASVTTGVEISIPLANLGYTPGTAIQAFVFDVNGASENRTDDQTLTPFSYFGSDGTTRVDIQDFDYTYIDSNHATPTSSADNQLDGRQFIAPVYPGAGFFTIPGVPEPTSLGALMIGGLTVLRRRSR